MSRDLLPAVVKEKAYQPDKWTSRHRRIVSLECAGFSPGEIAEIMQLSPSHVSVTLHDPRADLDRKLFAEKTIDIIQDVQLKIALHSDEALDEIIDEMRNCEDPRIRQKAAFGVLDRAGYTPVQKTQQLAPQLPPETVKKGMEVLAEMRAIDVQYRVIRREDDEDEPLE